MQRNAQRRRLLLVGHRRLDGLGSTDDDDAVAILEELVERGSPRDPERSGPETCFSRTCTVSIAMLSPSASRRRLATTRAPRARGAAGARAALRQADAQLEGRLEDGRIPLRRMSSVKDVIVSSWAIFGSPTNVPEPRRRTTYPSRARSSSAARSVNRDTPRSALSWRSEGIACADIELLDEVEHEVTRLALLRHRAPITVAVISWSVP